MDSLETTFHEVDSVIDVAILIPFCVFFSCAWNIAVDVWRIVDDDRRIQRFDKGVKVGMRRRIKVGDVGDEGTICEQEDAFNSRETPRFERELRTHCEEQHIVPSFFCRR